ncbi:MAG: NBR1-Ig-like domain-containing protein [Chloroflexota bacterium]
MQARNKIGFYLSGSHYPSGLQSWMNSLAEASIPFFLTVDAPGPAMEEAQALCRDTGETPHTLVYRNLAGPAEPDYHRAPKEAAGLFWEAHRTSLPDSLDKEVAWIEPMAISRTTEMWGDWLGSFAYELAQQMLSDGYKLAAFSFPVATPQIKLWERDEMQRFLLLCGRHPDRLGIALQEFSRQVDDIWFRRDDHIGRFYNLFATCDRAEISRPTVLISQWGWTPERIPTKTAVALEDVQSVAAYYARFPQIRGAAIWQITPEDAGIGWQTRRLITPLTEWTLNSDLEVTESFPAFYSSPEALGSANARFISDVTIPDDMRIPAGESFTKTWRVQNTGGLAWGAGFTLRHVAGESLGADPRQTLPLVQPGEIVDISIEMTAPSDMGVVFSDWRFHDKSGQAFGDVVYTRIEVIHGPDASGGVFDSKFLADVTVPDDVEVTPGQPLEKIWRLRNSGTRAWESGVSLACVGGNMLAPTGGNPVPVTAPGEETEVSVTITTPSTPGSIMPTSACVIQMGKPSAICCTSGSSCRNRQAHPWRCPYPSAIRYGLTAVWGKPVRRRRLASGAACWCAWRWWRVRWKRTRTPSDSRKICSSKTGFLICI